jgi:lon protease
LLDLYEKLANKISEKIRFVDLENTINSTMHGDLEEQQRDFMLREKMRQIRKMLNDNSEAKIKDVESDNEKQKKYPQYVLDAIKSEQARMASMMPSSPEANVSKTYIDLLLELP